FNNLEDSQKQAIANGADIYHGLGGNDVVTLPNIANYNELNWAAGSTFDTGDTAGQNYTITGGDGNDTIQLGDGNDVVFGSPGNDTIKAGTGQDTFDYRAGDYPNGSNQGFGDFNGFGASTQQTITAGHTTFQTDPTKQNIIKLPGSPADYNITVSFGSN